MLLKGGFETNDPRLDRLPQFDERSRNFPIRTLIPEAIQRRPRSYTWSFRSYDPHLDQHNEGACVGHGWANELALAPAMVAGISNEFAKEKIYWPAQRIDVWEGGSYPQADPHYEGTSVLAGAQVVQKELKLIGEYRWCFGLEDLLMALAYAGPVVLGIDWMTGMRDTDPEGFIHADGRAEGGHCIVARGARIFWLPDSLHRTFADVDLDSSFSVLRNSWGLYWGVAGDCKISLRDLDKLLKSGGEAVVPLQRSITERRGTSDA